MQQAFSAIVGELESKVYRQGIDYSLSHFGQFMAEARHPERQLPPVVHIAGTNGKGSTLQFLAAMLSANGYRVGTYTSPHILSYCERIQIQDTPISEADFVRYYQKAGALPSAATQTAFAHLTLMAFLYFQDQQPDIICLETGLGGRADCTNVVSPVLSVITPIGLDHQHILGDTLEAIATEKAGIIKWGAPVVSAVQPPGAAAVLTAESTRQQSPIRFVAPLAQLPEGTGLSGAYQTQNLAVALAALANLESQGVIRTRPEQTAMGSRSARNWGRFLRLERSGQQIIVDAAHNPMGAEALVAALTAAYPAQKWGMLFHILTTKSYVEMAQTFAAHAERLYYPVGGPDTYVPFEAIQAALPGYTVHPWPFESASLPQDPFLAVTGSIYFISELNARGVL